jgi:aminodeoxyfutalosine synthase
MDAARKRELEAKVSAGERLSREDGVALFGSDDLLWLGRLAHDKRSELHGDRVTFGAEVTREATMVYGEGESHEQRVDELLRVRDQQDADGALLVFTPLREKREAAPAESLKTFAVARLLLDNVPHLRCRRELIGDSVAQLTLNFGVDDLDGSKKDDLDGAEDEELLDLIWDAGFEPVERDEDFAAVKAHGAPVPYSKRRSEPQKVWA